MDLREGLALGLVVVLVVLLRYSPSRLWIGIAVLSLSTCLVLEVFGVSGYAEDFAQAAVYVLLMGVVSAGSRWFGRSIRSRKHKPDNKGRATISNEPSG